MAVIQIAGAIFACKIGEGTNRYTIVTTDRRSFYGVEGTACLYEASQAEALKVCCAVEPQRH